MEFKLCFVFLLILCFKVNVGFSEETNTSKLTMRRNVISLLKCAGDESPRGCGREIATVVLDNVETEIEKQMKNWEEEADAEVITTGRAVSKMPSEIGREIMKYRHSLVKIFAGLVSRALRRNNYAQKHEMGRKFDQNTIQESEDFEDSSISEDQYLPEARTFIEGRGIVRGIIRMWNNAMGSLFGPTFVRRQGQGADGLGGLNFTRQRISVEDILITGAVIKGSIALLIQFINLHLQIKFFIVFLSSFAVELARLYLEYTRLPLLPMQLTSPPSPMVTYIIHPRHEVTSSAPFSSTVHH